MKPFSIVVAGVIASAIILGVGVYYAASPTDAAISSIGVLRFSGREAMNEAVYKDQMWVLKEFRLYAPGANTGTLSVRIGTGSRNIDNALLLQQDMSGVTDSFWSTSEHLIPPYDRVNFDWDNVDGNGWGLEVYSETNK